MTISLSLVLELLLIVLLFTGVVLGCICVSILLKVKRIVSRIDMISDLKGWVSLFKTFNRSKS